MDTLMKFLEFTFQSFWHFLGMFLLIGMILQGIVWLVRGKKP